MIGASGAAGVKLLGMASDTGDLLRRHEKVVAAEDLPGVPEGTHGIVVLVNGITWIRYRVIFDNGVDLGQLNRETLIRPGEWAERRRAAAELEREALID